jgi:hypothetical protein
VGHGHTIFGGGSETNKVEWGEGSLFTVPLNVQHRHYNSDPMKLARLLAITLFPMMLQLFGSLRLINEMPFDFRDRNDGSPDYFKRTKRIVPFCHGEITSGSFASVEMLMPPIEGRRNDRSRVPVNLG